ncbi:MAG: hypothetical protein M1286_03800 [Candidatus Marsarchaeota archaeon]|nr:hypothetical protein [Candidatus Marsarchaeota archaeon]
MEKLLDQGEKNVALSSVKRNLVYLSVFTRRDVRDYKVSFLPEIVETDTGNSLTLSFDLRNREIQISEKEYEGMNEFIRKYGDKFPALQVEYSMDKYLARKNLPATFNLTAQSTLDMVTGNRPRLKEADLPFYLSNFTVRYEETLAITNAMLKLISVMSLYDDGSEHKNWKRFAEMRLRSLRETDMSWLRVEEGNEEIRNFNFNAEFARAADEWSQKHGFGEYTLRFLDRLNDRTNDMTTHQELLSDVFASVFLHAYPKRAQLEERILSFFDVQYSKEALYELALPIKKPKAMVVMEETDRDEFIRKLRRKAQKSPFPPERAVDVAKEWSEN